MAFGPVEELMEYVNETLSGNNTVAGEVVVFGISEELYSVVEALVTDEYLCTLPLVVGSAVDVILAMVNASDGSLTAEKSV